MQWTNFASWLIVGGLLVGALAVLWALIDLFRLGSSRRKGQTLYVLALSAMWAFAFVNALVHAKDAWGSMPEGLYLSAIATLLAFIAAWMGYSRFEKGEVK